MLSVSTLINASKQNEFAYWDRKYLQIENLVIVVFKKIIFIPFLVVYSILVIQSTGLILVTSVCLGRQ